MIIVTGATGNIGKDVVKELQGMGARIRVVARDPEKARKFLGNVEIVQGDLTNRASLDAAFRGGTKLFLLGPAGPTQVAEQHNAIEAARAAGITHVVKLSAMGAEAGSKVSLGRWHAQTEAELKRSGLKWTILQPSNFMQNFLRNAGTIKRQGVIYGSSKDGKIAMVDTRDIARVASHALVDPGHEGKTYVLTGGEAVSYAQVAATFSRVLGKPVKYVDMPPEQAKPAMLGMGLPAWIVDDLLTLGLNLRRWTWSAGDRHRREGGEGQAAYHRAVCARSRQGVHVATAIGHCVTRFSGPRRQVALRAEGTPGWAPSSATRPQT